MQVGSTKAKIQIWSALAFDTFPPLLSFPVSSCLCFTFLMTILITQTISGLEFLTLRCFSTSSQRHPQGHCRPRAISHHYFILLPWSSWNDPCFRPCQPPVLPVRGQVDARGLPPLSSLITLLLTRLRLSVMLTKVLPLSLLATSPTWVKAPSKSLAQRLTSSETRGGWIISKSVPRTTPTWRPSSNASLSSLWSTGVTTTERMRMEQETCDRLCDMGAF